MTDHRKCAGFTIDLVWNSRASIRGVGAVQIRGGRPKRGFKFVQGGARSKRRANDRPSNRHNSPDGPIGLLEDSIMLTMGSPPYELEASMVTEAVTPMSSNGLDDPDTFGAIGMEVARYRQGLMPAPSSILFNDLAHKMEPVLNMCEISRLEYGSWSSTY